MQLIHHKGLNLERWAAFPLHTQLLNVGSEISRAREMRRAGDRLQEERCYERALELIDITIETTRNLAQLRELTLLREAVASFTAKSELNISLDLLYNYLLQFSTLK